VHTHYSNTQHIQTQQHTSTYIEQPVAKQEFARVVRASEKVRRPERFRYISKELLTRVDVECVFVFFK